MKKFYPAYLILTDKRCLVVGGGAVSARKVKALLNCKARVVVVSPHLSPALEGLVKEGKIEHIADRYQPRHLEQVFLVIGSTSDPEVNSRVAQDCLERNIPVNIVDTPELCSFFVPSVVTRGALSVAISTGGKSPALARRLREELEEYFGVHYEGYLEFLGKLRPRILTEISDPGKRKALFKELAGKEFCRLFLSNSPREMERKVDALIDLYREDETNNSQRL